MPEDIIKTKKRLDKELFALKSILLKLIRGKENESKIIPGIKFIKISEKYDSIVKNINNENIGENKLKLYKTITRNINKKLNDKIKNLENVGDENLENLEDEKCENKNTPIFNKTFNITKLEDEVLQEKELLYNKNKDSKNIIEKLKGFTNDFAISEDNELKPFTWEESKRQKFIENLKILNKK